MENQHETNLFDLCAMCAKAIRKSTLACTHALGSMIRLTLRKWYIVMPVTLLCIAAALYYTRPSNRWYEADAVLLLNGPDIEMTKHALQRISYGVGFSEHQNNTVLLGLSEKEAANIQRLETFDVIDCLFDSVPDFIDYKGSVTRVDSFYTHMRDRVAIRFRIRDVNLLPKFENAMMTYLNSLPQMQQRYATQLANLEKEADFCHRQYEKLDSLTSAFYFEQGNTTSQIQYARWSSGMMIGKREITLFLGEINHHARYMQYIDHKLAQCTDPIVMEDHICFTPRAINGPIKLSAIALIVGWLIGCLLAVYVEKRKQISAWVKQ